MSLETGDGLGAVMNVNESDDTDLSRPNRWILRFLMLVLMLAPAFAGFAVGWSIWAFSKAVTGAVEPWDASGSYYWWCLAAGGFLCALVCPRCWFLAPLGIYVGQIAYMETIYGPSLRPGDPVFLPAFIAVAVFGMLPALVGAVLAFVVYLLVRFGRRRLAAGRGS